MAPAENSANRQWDSLYLSEFPLHAARHEVKTHSELMLGRRVRMTLDLLRLDPSGRHWSFNYFNEPRRNNELRRSVEPLRYDGYVPFEAPARRDEALLGDAQSTEEELPASTAEPSTFHPLPMFSTWSASAFSAPSDDLPDVKDESLRWTPRPARDRHGSVRF